MSKIITPVVFFIVLLILIPGANQVLLRTNRPTLPPSATPSTKTLATPPLLSGTTNEQTNLKEFNYPNSTPASIDENGLTLKSSDDSTAITDWYKNRIKSLGMNTTTFIDTNTNGNILNKLVGSDGKQQIAVEISKKSNQKEVGINLHVIN